jgi:hypothetical protein
MLPCGCLKMIVSYTDNNTFKNLLSILAIHDRVIFNEIVNYIRYSIYLQHPSFKIISQEMNIVNNNINRIRYMEAYKKIYELLTNDHVYHYITTENRNFVSFLYNTETDIKKKNIIQHHRFIRSGLPINYYTTFYGKSVHLSILINT